MSVLAGGAFAQEIQNTGSPDSQEDTLGEVTVTAMKRDTQLQDTPLAITAVTGDMLEKAGAVTMAEYAKFVPSLKLSDDGPGRSRVSLRGIVGSGESMVGVFYDETPITGSVGVSSDAGGRNPDTSAGDVQRVEALRGPQGTLFGGSTMGGAIRLIFNKPKFEYEGLISGSISSINGGGINTQVTGIVNVPLIADKLAARLVVYNRENAGWLENNFLNKEDINTSTVTGGRLLVRWFATNDLMIDAGIHLQSTKAVSNNNWNPFYGDYVQASKLLLPYTEDTKIYSLTANWDLHGMKLTANSSYFESESVYAADDTNFVAGYRTPARCTTYLGVACTDGTQRYTDYLALVNSYYPAAIYYPGTTHNFTNEIRLASDNDAKLAWTVGLFAENRIEDVESGDTLADAVSGQLLTPINFIYHRFIDDHLTQQAIFGEVSYDVTEKLNVSVGGRAFRYEKTVGGEVDVPWLLINAPLTPYTVVSSKEDGSIFKFNANYDINDDIMVYGTVAEGFRPGGVNQVIGLPQLLTPYTSDSLTNYELGIKSSWFGNMLTANAAIYQIDWEDMQISGRTLNNAFSFISNAGAAKVQGIEIELSAVPVKGLTITANGGFNDAKLTEDQINANVSAPGKAGDRIPNIPRLSFGGSVQYAWSVGDAGDVYVRADANYVGSTTSDLRPNNANYRKTPSYYLANLRFGFEAADGWDATLFVNNVFDTIAISRLTVSSTTPLGGSVTSAPPRTVGMSLTKSF